MYIVVIKYLTPEKIQSLVDQLKLYILPKLKVGKDELIQALREKAKSSHQVWDDKAVDILDQFLTALITQV